MADAKRPPGPSLPGAVQGIAMLRRPLDFLEYCRRRYGDVFRLSVPGIGKLVYVADPVEIKRIFLGPADVFHGGEGNAEFTEPALGMGVMNLDGDEHMRHRKLLLPPFHGENVHHFESEVFTDAALRDMRRWPLDTPFELLGATQRISLDAILRALLGDPREVMIEDVSRAMLRFDRTGWVLALRPLQRDLGPLSPWRRFKTARAGLDKLLYREIAARRRHPDGEGRDVLSLLLAAHDEDGREMSDRELRDELVTMIVAGYETTSASLAHAFERVLRTPHVLARLLDDLDDDEYLNAIVAETLRLRPSVTDASRVLATETEVAGYTLPAGQHIVVALPLVLTRPETYRDPHLFRPERFLEDGEQEPYTYIPWGGGVRRCIGSAFAQAEMRAVLRAVFGHASLEAASPKPEPPRVHRVLLVPGHGAKTVMKKRLPPRAARTAQRDAVAAG